MKHSARTGAIAALFGMFPMAFLVTLFWRFPMPMAGYRSGFEAATMSPFAVIFYGLFGGFLVVPALGALAGRMAFKQTDGNIVRAKRLSVAYGLSCALMCCLIISVLDEIIGPW